MFLLGFIISAAFLLLADSGMVLLWHHLSDLFACECMKLFLIIKMLIQTVIRKLSLTYTERKKILISPPKLPKSPKESSTYYIKSINDIQNILNFLCTFGILSILLTVHLQISSQLQYIFSLQCLQEKVLITIVHVKTACVPQSLLLWVLFNFNSFYP